MHSLRVCLTTDSRVSRAHRPGAIHGSTAPGCVTARQIRHHGRGVAVRVERTASLVFMCTSCCTRALGPPLAFPCIGQGAGARKATHAPRSLLPLIVVAVVAILHVGEDQQSIREVASGARSTRSACGAVSGWSECAAALVRSLSATTSGGTARRPTQTEAVWTSTTGSLLNRPDPRDGSPSLTGSANAGGARSLAATGCPVLTKPSRDRRPVRVAVQGGGARGRQPAAESRCPRTQPVANTNLGS